MGQLIRSLELESLTTRPKDGSVRDVRDIARLLDSKDLSRQPLGESTRFRTTLYAEQILAARIKASCIRLNEAV